MSRLDELIQELCPDGVPHLTLDAVSHYAKKRIDATTVNAETYVSVENLLQNKQGKTIASTVPTTGNVIGFESGDILIGNIRPYLRKIWLADCDGGTNGDVLAIQINDRNQLMPKFLYYILSSEDFFNYDNQNAKGAKMPRGDKAAVMKYVLPIPPLPVQEEIVRILDTFTTLTAELTAELTARKKQYEYYADQLFMSDIPQSDWLAISETIVSLKTGLNPRQNFKLNVGGDKPYITGKDIFNNAINISDRTDLITDDAIALINRRACLENNDVLFASTGTGTVGRMAVVNGYNNDWAVSETMYCLKPKANVINPYYLMYALYTKSAKGQFVPKISKGSVPHLKVKDLLDVKIPVPSMVEQERIIGLMRKFDTLCNDISTGLPAEIEARQKQYEYYRDKLLSFKELA